MSAKTNDKGAFTIFSGGCNDWRIDGIPITPGWDFVIRTYPPRPEGLDRTWTFPPIEPSD